MVETTLLWLAVLTAGVAIPYALLSALFLAGADDEANKAAVALVGLLIIPASVVSLLAVVALLRGQPVTYLWLRLLAPAVLAAAVGPFGGPRSWHHAPETGRYDVVTSAGYFRPGDPGYPAPTPPDPAAPLRETGRMVAVLLVTPTLVTLAQLAA